MNSTLRFFIAGVGLLGLLPEVEATLTARVRFQSCDEVCNPYVPCDTPCNGTTYEEPWENTCGNHQGGAANGFCESTCGNGTCEVENGEDHWTCESDCALPERHGDFIRWPDDGYAWSARAQNYPNGDRVGHCYGNCGPGCAFYDAWIPICGTPEQYWELTITSQPQIISQGPTCFCADGNNLYECGELTKYVAAGQWTYHGWKAAGCYTHDTTCRTPWWASVFFGFIGYVIMPGSWGFWEHIVTLVFNPFISCRLDFASFVWGGMCANAGPDEWPYITTVYADSFWHDRYEYGEPGSCASGPPQCGDGICQTNGCELGESGAGHAPGNGCEEDASNCSDCG